MKFGKRLLALVLCAFMLFGVIACTKEDQQQGNEEINGDSLVSTESGSPFDGYEIRVKDFDKYEFRILVADGDYGVETYTVEDYGESILEQKIYARNVSIQERLNITLSSKVEPAKSVKSTIDTLCGTGTFEYDCFSIQMTHGMPLVTKGYMASDSGMRDYIDLSRPWWDEAAIEQLGIGGINYTFIGDAVLHYFESMWMMAYNHTLATNIQLPNLAQLALDGGWTLELLNQYIQQAYVDTDYSSSKTDGDIFGATIPNTFVQAMLISSGETLLDFDESNYPSFSAFSDRAIKIFDFIRQEIYQSEKVFIGPRDNVVNSENFHATFLSGEALFWAEPMGSLQKLKDVNFGFTVIPLPKYDADSEYLTAIQKYAEAILVPNATLDIERTGIILENLMYESYIQVRPAYYETVASLQRTRNLDSYRVLNEIVFPSEKRINMVLVYDFGEIADNLISYAFENKSLSTLGASLKRGINNEIAKVLGGRE